MKTISLTFDGYWLEANKNELPSKPGIYCVYACTYNKDVNTVSIRKLIYVGESENVHDRIDGHERLEDWKKQLNSGETLCYSFAGISGDDKNRAEAAVIYHHKPPCNVEYKNSFPFVDTTIHTARKNATLASNFIVRNTR